MSVLAAIGGIVGSILGKPKTISGGANLTSVMQAAQQAEKYGFNPLEALRSGAAGIGATVTGGIPGLASSLASVGDAVDPATRAAEKQEAERRKLEMDLARIKLEQARSGVVYAPSPSAVTFGRGAGLGSRVSTQGGIRTSTPKAKLGGPFNITGDRDIKDVPLSDTGGVFQVDNDLTGGPITIPGDSEPWGVDELATAAFTGLPQVAWNWGSRAGEWLRKRPQFRQFVPGRHAWELGFKAKHLLKGN